MWDRGRFRVCGGDFVELGRTRGKKERYDRGSQLLNQANVMVVELALTHPD